MISKNMQQIIDIVHSITIVNESLSETHKLFSTGLSDDMIHHINTAYQKLYQLRRNLIESLENIDYT